MPTLTRPNLWPNLRAGVTVTHYALRPYRINQELKRRGSRENAAEGQFNEDLRQQESLLGVTLSISTLSLYVRLRSGLFPLLPQLPSTTWSPHSTQSPSKATKFISRHRAPALAAFSAGCRPACHTSSLSSPAATPRVKGNRHCHHVGLQKLSY